jgi:hypothetical protein
MVTSGGSEVVVGPRCPAGWRPRSLTVTVTRFAGRDRPMSRWGASGLAGALRCPVRSAKVAGYQPRRPDPGRRDAASRPFGQPGQVPGDGPQHLAPTPDVPLRPNAGTAVDACATRYPAVDCVRGPRFVEDGPRPGSPPRATSRASTARCAWSSAWSGPRQPRMRRPRSVKLRVRHVNSSKLSGPTVRRRLPESDTQFGAEVYPSGDSNARSVRD